MHFSGRVVVVSDPPTGLALTSLHAVSRFASPAVTLHYRLTRD
jgi:hypothetical protein